MLTSRLKFPFFLFLLLAAFLLGKLTAPDSRTHPSPVAFAAGSQEKFDYLSNQRSNSCGLLASSVVATKKDEDRIQGSCCGPMDLHRYQEQVEALQQYATIPQIPEDPYDIPLPLAKELLGYKDGITLTEGEQALYDEAMRLSDEGGPCCCRCWRWDAFDGLARYLVHEKQFGSEEVARVWNLLDGCGGSGHTHDHMS